MKIFLTGGTGFIGQAMGFQHPRTRLVVDGAGA
jgi:NAD dependent epimerase/dehydratase family enzyme